MTRTWSERRSPSKRTSSLHQPLLQGSSSSNAHASSHASDNHDLEQGVPEAPQTASVLRLLREARPEAWTLSVATIFLLIGSLANLAVPKIAGGNTRPDTTLVALNGRS
jgi:hypothetical protein